MEKSLMIAFGAAVLAASQAGCQQGGGTRKAEAARQGAASEALPATLATVGGEPITAAEVRKRAGDQLDQLETQYQRARSRIIEAALDSMMRERLLGAEARKQGRTIEQLVAAEAGPGREPTDAEIAAWYRENQQRLGGRTLDQIRPQIADFLRTQRRQAAEERLTQRLRAARGVTVSFEPYRFRFDDAGAPARGPANAPVTLVEFSDFQCPFCRAVAPSLQLVEKQFGDRVRVVYRQFPIPSLHPNAFKAAEASLCADEQGKFWAMHDLMFAEQDRLTVTELKEKARRLGLDQGRFDRCLDTGRYVEQVQKDLKEGERAGITGTPQLYVNGIPLEAGAVPYPTIEAAINRELARAKR